MAKPTEDYTWATDTNFADPGQDWDAQPTKVEPGPTGYRQQGFLPARLLPADFLNWLFNAIGKWLTWFDARFASDGASLYDNAQRSFPLSHMNFRPDAAAGALDWNPDASKWVSAQNNAQLFLPLEAHMPLAGHWDTFRVLVTPGAARTGTNKVSVSLWKQDVADGAVTQVGSTVYDDGTTNQQEIVLSNSSVFDLSANDFAWYLMVKAGNTGSASPDSVYMARITLTATKGRL